MITNFTRNGGSTVTSVNGQIGAVALDSVEVPLTAPLGAVPAATEVQAALEGLGVLSGLGVSSGAFDPATGTLSLTLVDGTVVAMPLDGRYQIGNDTFVSTLGTIVNNGLDAQNLDLDVDAQAVFDAQPVITAAQQAGLAVTDELLAQLADGSVVQLSIGDILGLAGGADTFASALGTIVNSGADGSNLDLDVDAQAVFNAQPVITAAQQGALATTDELLAQLADGSVVQLSIGDILGLATNSAVAGLVFDPATGNLDLTLADGTVITAPLDGRYVRTVNAVVPDINGNVPVALTAVETGTAAYQASLTPTNGTVFVVSGDPDPTQNGKTYIWEAGSAAWYQVVGYDTPAMDARYVNASGDTMLGSLTLANDPTTALQAATKQYVDQAYDWIKFPSA